MKLSIVIPLYNEEAGIPQLYTRLKTSLKKDFPKEKYEIVFVDDGSTDNSFSVLKKIHLKDKQVKIIQFSRNFGHHIALSAGLDVVTGDYVVMMDGDLQDKPEEIITLYKKIKQGYDVVYADRIDKKFGIIKKINSKLFNIVIRYLIHDDIVINSTIFRITTKQVISEIKKLRESNRYLVGIIGWVGFSHVSQPVSHGERYTGVTKYSFKKQWQLALNAIFSHSTYPLALFLKIGITLFFISLSIFFYNLYIALTFDHVFFSLELLLSAIVFIGSMQTIIIAFIGEYIARLFIENKTRPLYVIKNKLGNL